MKTAANEASGLEWFTYCFLNFNKEHTKFPRNTDLSIKICIPYLQYLHSVYALCYRAYRVHRAHISH